jgi:hypothetical protein
MTTFPFPLCCSMLGVAPKTLRQWLHEEEIEPRGVPPDTRLKLLTLEQLYHLARLHRRSITPPELPASQDDTISLDSPGSASPEPEAGLSQQAPSSAEMGRLEGRLITLQEQVIHLTLLLAQSGLVPDRPSLLTLQQESLSCAPQERGSPAQPPVQRTPPPHRSVPHPAEKHRAPLLPLIEYGVEGRSVLICPQAGELHLAPDSAEWFGWLASLSSFRFVGLAGRFSASRGYRQQQRTRTWWAVRCMGNRNYKHYLGTTEHLTLARLEEVAALLQSSRP